MEHRNQYWMFCSDFYCKAHSTTNMLRNWYLPDYQSTCSTCGRYGHSTITCPISGKILALHKLSSFLHPRQSSQSDRDWSPPPTDSDWASGSDALATSAACRLQELPEVVVYSVRDRLKEVSAGSNLRPNQKRRKPKWKVSNTTGIKLSQTVLIVFLIQDQQSH